MFKFVLLGFFLSTVNCDVAHLLKTGFLPRVPAPIRPIAHHNNYKPGHEAHVQILRQDSDIQPDGSYHYSYETENGIGADEQSAIRILGPEQVAKTSQGSFHWTSPEGQPIYISYIADENGYQPQGADLPTPPPIPAAIQRALDWIASHPQPQQPITKRRF